MNIVDKLIEKIKTMFKKNKQKLLTDGISEVKEKNNYASNYSFNSGLKVNQRRISKETKMQNNNKNDYEIGTIDDAIDQYLQGIAYNYQNNNKFTSYSVLTGLFAHSNQFQGDNLQKEKALITSLRSLPQKYNLNIQGAKEPAFYHIKSNNFKEYDKDKIVRLYINVKRENVAELSKELISAFKDEAFYLKFLADNQMNKKSRTESIVIYENKEKINRTLQIVEEIKRKNPYIFQDSEKMGNPFLRKTCDNVVSYAPEVYGNYIDSMGINRAIPESFNSKLSVALGEAYLNAVQEIVSNNKDIRRKMDSSFLDNLDFFKYAVRTENGVDFKKKVDEALNIFGYAYKFIAENDKDELVQNVKKNLFDAIKRNPIIEINEKQSKKIDLER